MQATAGGQAVVALEPSVPFSPMLTLLREWLQHVPEWAPLAVDAAIQDPGMGPGSPPLCAHAAQQGSSALALLVCASRSSWEKNRGFEGTPSTRLQGRGLHLGLFGHRGQQPRGRFVESQTLRRGS